MDALTVDLDFIVGHLPMSVGELSALSRGRIVPLGTPIPARVRIVAHGTELGLGRLVEIDGQLAIEIDVWGGAR
ncbi:FliM/FliN family flagellar motor switch protein [Roseateles chitosanitabidus]|uniref:FliM/FliN family flagellar motor switch protein n=1 Tax=Roseateles chitosanitabidus TaxID=65048 RepID=UPI00082EDB62|nr:FliM/FliN family flagellar motor switch protein [Roseateles chitosanitabidus]MBO9688736.1 FliM/FliN family flagellar motor switch protein [Roseateles chitosanitabidus]